MERVDHIDVGKICRRGLVGKVDRVLEREAPHRERLILGIAGLHAALVLMIELAEAGGHLAGAGAGGRHDDDGARRLDVVVLAEAVVRDDQADVRGIVLDGIVLVDLHAEILQLMLEEVGRVLPGVLRDDDGADVEADAAERIDQAHDVHIICDAEITAALVLLDVARADCDDDLRLLLQLEQHFHLPVRLKARQDARGVIVVKELAAELEIELAAEAVDPLENFFRLKL